MEVVLVHPQIPQNTGSIARTCAATETPLHLIEPLGFELSEKKIRRAGLDYWPYVTLTCHASWAAFLEQKKNGNIWLFSTHATRLYSDVQYTPDDYLVFGSETKGLGEDFIHQYPAEQCLTLPMCSPHVRSLNLSNAVSIALYHALFGQKV